MTSTTMQPAGALPATTAIGRVRLRVADLDRSIAFYRDLLGFDVDREGSAATLSAGTALVELREAPGLSPARPGASGLYHFAILLPGRTDLARFARHLIEHRVRFGQSDHTVSEALYFDDPDGIGIEVYADRPRATWPVADGVVRFTGDPIDFQDLLSELSEDDPGWTGMPVGTTIGHVHLRVSDVEQSLSFYERLGFELTADFVRGARFVSAGGYHHHLGMNEWQSRGRPVAAGTVAGLDSFEIVLPDRESWRAAVNRVGGDSVYEIVAPVHDPDGIAFDLVYRG